MVSEQTNLFSLFELKLFLGLFTPPEHRNDKQFISLYYCDSVLLSLRDRFVGVKL